MINSTIPDKSMNLFELNKTIRKSLTEGFQI